MKNKWHDSDKQKPAKDQVVVGYWDYLTETVAELCYYDKDTKEWFSASTGGIDCALRCPDYWIETPYD